jgi:hypothetical protein
MTLILTIVAPWGIWQSCDFRLSRDGVPVDDFSIKHLHLTCADGTALLGYSGVGWVNGCGISDWVREILRGECRTVGQTVEFLRQKADSSLAPICKRRFPHVFCVGAFCDGQPWFIEICNYRRSDGVVRPEFEVIAHPIEGNCGMAFGGGEVRAVRKVDHGRLAHVASKRPRFEKEYRDLLARINKDASCSPNYGSIISRGCITSFLSPKGEHTGNMHGVPPGKRSPEEPPILLYGLDMTETWRAMVRRDSDWRLSSICKTPVDGLSSSH